MRTFGIVGLGVMGASFASRLRQLGHTVIGFDINPQSLDYALDHQLIDEGSTNPQQGLERCDTVILCLYPTAMKTWLETYGSFLKPGCLVLEISGVKESVLPGLRQAMPEQAELLSIHPMCGRESRGPAFSSPEIFQDANFLIIPDKDNSPQAIVEATSMAKELGCRNIRILSPHEHDQMIGFLSQLTHVIAVSLMNTHENAHLVEYTGDSFRDLTRIAKINEDMWSELFLLNKDVLLEEIGAFEASLDRFKQALAAKDTQTMRTMFIESTERRKRFDK